MHRLVQQAGLQFNQLLVEMLQHGCGRQEYLPRCVTERFAAVQSALTSFTDADCVSGLDNAWTYGTGGYVAPVLPTSSTDDDRNVAAVLKPLASANESDAAEMLQGRGPHLSPSVEHAGHGQCCSGPSPGSFTECCHYGI